MNSTARTHRFPYRLASRVLRTRLSWKLVSLAGLAIATALVVGGPLRAERAGNASHQGHPRGMPMTEKAMRAHAKAYWATHEPVGTSTEAPQGAPAATFSVGDFFFDNGGPTQVDTAKIAAGESVLWQWVAGIHTVTNGTDSSDPNVGTLFDQPSDSGNPPRAPRLPRGPTRRGII